MSGSLKRWTLLLICAFLAIGKLSSQPVPYQIDAEDTVAGAKLDRMAGKVFSDSVLLMTALDKIISELHTDGYFLAGLNNVRWKGDTLTGNLSAGKKYAFKLSGLGSKKLPDENTYTAFFRKELEKHLNSGYPFAKVYVDSARLQGDTIWAHAAISKGPFIVFDSLSFSGAPKTRNSFLQKFLQVVPGQPYSEKTVQELSERIGSLSFLRLSAPPTITFYSGMAGINLTLEEPAVNQLDGILGFLPNQNSNTGKLLLTGQLNADLYNLFGSGKHFFFHWQNFNLGSQQLNVLYDHPLLFGTPLDLHLAFDQLKQDSAFVTRDAAAGFSLKLSAATALFFNAGLRSNSLLSENAQVDFGELINADSRTTEYGIALQYSSLNDYILPSSGKRAVVRTTLGQKDIIKNAALDEGLYENVALSTLQFSFFAGAENHWMLFNNSVFVQQFSLATVQNRQLFQNDLYRLGGLADEGLQIRGFNQNQFFAKSLALLGLEWRFLVDDQSYLLGFVDQGLFASRQREWTYAAGLGTGLMLKVKAGFFRLAFAVGSSGGSGFDFSQPKVHFGFINRF